MGKIFDPRDSVIDEETDLDSFVPPHIGWNYVRLLRHPEDNKEYSHYYCGKWLLFVPDSDFISVFRTLAKLTKDFNLTHCFKASGSSERGSHVFCIYCLDCTDIVFIRKIAVLLKALGFLDKYGYRYKGGMSAIFFKTDEATHYKSKSLGSSITLYRYTSKDELSIKEFVNMKPRWKNVENQNVVKEVDKFYDHLTILDMNGYSEDE